MRKTIVRVICLILLIPVLGFALSFGSAYVYGKIRYAEKKSTVASILDAHENELFEIMEDHTAVPKITDSLKRLLDLPKTGSSETSMLGCVSKIPEAHFRHLELHFCVDFPRLSPTKPSENRLEMQPNLLETASPWILKHTLETGF